MAFKTFAPGVLTSSDVNTFLMKQAVITCTAATRPASPNEGMLIYETDTDLIRTYDGSAWKVSGAAQWKSYTPGIGGLGSPTIGNGTITGQYARVGDAVHLFIRMIAGTTTTFSTTSTFFSLPSGLNVASGERHLGKLLFFDDSAGSYTPGQCDTDSAVVGAVIQWFNVPSTPSPVLYAQLTTAVRPFVFTTSDEIRLSLTYRTDAA